MTTAKTIQIRSATPDLYSEILQLNEGAVPHVNSIPLHMLSKLADESRHFLVAFNKKEVAGFVLALDEKADYESPNFRYFCNEFRRFMYVDRIVVNPDFQRLGIGRLLYDTLLQRIGDIPVLTCEVNIKPPNPDSLAFHERLGFTGIGEQDTENGAKRVKLMARRCETTANES